ncbi:MAG: SOS response-associated peptidase [Armatimonadota bacterium]
MCGRYTLSDIDMEVLKRIFLLQNVPDLRPRYNIAPTQEIPVVEEAKSTNERSMEMVRWGLIPFWAESPGTVSNGTGYFNLRSETVQKGGWIPILKNRRCLIPASGFYEWKKIDEKTKQPQYIQRPKGEPLAFAGIYDHWKDKNGDSEIHGCAIITTDANSAVQPIHHRMPVIIPESIFDVWLDPDFKDLEAIASFLRPYDGPLVSHGVSTHVNSPRNDTPECIAALV